MTWGPVEADCTIQYADVVGLSLDVFRQGSVWICVGETLMRVWAERAGWQSERRAKRFPEEARCKIGAESLDGRLIV